MIVDHVVFVVVVVAVVVVAVVVVVVAFVIDAAAAAEFDVVISADAAAVVFDLVVVPFVVAAGASNFENGDGDFSVAYYFLEIFADYFGDLDDIVESTVCRLHLTALVDLAVFL